MRNRQAGFDHRRSILLICFFLSGAAGLSYEVLWTRLLSLFFGHTVYAVTTVLAAFMGGLALGSWLIGKWADRTERPLRLYGVLEVAIGLSCLALPGMLETARGVYLSLYPLFAESISLRTFFQFALAFILLIIPTTLMGGTLPAVTRGIVTSAGQTGKEVAILYGTNTLGAVAGAIASGYWLLPAIGIKSTNILGVAGNLTVGLVVLAMFGKVKKLPEGETAAPLLQGTTTALERTLLLGFFFSGAAAMIYQIAWVRSLILVIGNSTYAFSAIVVTFLLGLSLGSFLYRSLPGREKPYIFALLQIGIGLAALLLIPFFNHLPRVFLVLFSRFDGSFAYVLLIQFLIVLPIVLIPTTFMGMTFPCLAGILSRKLNRVGSDVGRLYAWNTLGAIMGSIAAGFILIPYLGAQNALTLGVGINAATATAVLILTKPALRPFLAVVTPFAVALLVLVPSWNRKAMVSGVATYPMKYLRQDGTPNREALYENPEVLYFREGISTTVAVTKELDDNIVYRVNGKPGASFIDLETNIKLAYIPLMHHPDPRRIAIIGMGSGVTAGVATLFDGIEAIDIIELEPAVLGVPPYFSTRNFALLEDPRVTVHFDDGRSRLSGLPNTFDVVVSEPSNPWIAGESNLFTREFAAMVKAKLAPGGIFGQWLQGYNLTPESFKLVVRTFRDVFPGATLWELSSTDYLLLGTREGWEPTSLEGLTKRIRRNPRLVEVFPRMIDDDPLLTVFRSFRLGEEALASYSGDGTLNTDDRNILEFQAPRSLYRQEYKRISAGIYAMKRQSFPSLVLDPKLKEPANLLRFGTYLMDRGALDEAAWHFSQVPSLEPPRDEMEILSLPETRIIAFDFDAPSPIPLIPLVGLFRPEEEKSLAKWQAHLDYFTRISGLVKGRGISGGTALRLRGLGGVAHASYFIPLAVESDTEYLVSFSLKSLMGGGGQAGVGILEFDSLNPAGAQPSLSFIKEHQLSAEDMVRVSGTQEQWHPYSFSFRTSSSSKMAHIVFYREGRMDAGEVYFDDISFEKTNGILPLPGGSRLD